MTYSFYIRIYFIETFYYAAHMVIFKKQYFLIIENTRDINLSNIKKKNKFTIIYRYHKSDEKFSHLLRFKYLCKKKSIKLYIANNLNLALKLKADGLYVSSYNKNLKFKNYITKKFEIIGSAHNLWEINLKRKQGCNSIFLSRLFKTDYEDKKGFLGLIRFNLISKSFKNLTLIPLGGIRLSNLNYLKDVSCTSLAIFSEVKKKPAKIFSRLF